jgi:hypothetical protein
MIEFRRVYRLHRPSRRVLWIFLAVAVSLSCLTVAVSFYAGASLVRDPSPVQASDEPVRASDLTLLNTAEQLLIRACMQGQGFGYWPIPASRLAPVPSYPLVVTNIGWAQANGLSNFPVEAPDVNQQYYDHLPANRQNVYSNALVGPSGSPSVTVALPSGGIEGASSQGCQARAESELYGNYRAWFQASTVARDLPRLWLPMVEEDNKYQRAVAQWSQCMRRKGYRYSSPGQAAAAFPRSTLSRPSGAEVAVAVAEATCGGRTGLSAVVSSLSREFSAQVEHKYQSSLSTEWRLERNAVARARHLLDSISR